MLNEAYTSQIQLSWGNLLLCYTHAYPELRKSQLRKCSRMINIMWNNVMKRCSQIIRRQSDTPKKKGGCGHEDKHRKDKINIKDMALVNLLYRVNVVLKAGFPFCLKNKTNKQKKSWNPNVASSCGHWRQKLSRIFLGCLQLTIRNCPHPTFKWQIASLLITTGIIQLYVSF